MRKLLILFVFAVLAICISGQVSFGNAGLFNQNWKFSKGDFKDAPSDAFNDSRWRDINLPHDWSVEGPLSPSLASANGYLPGGIAWYRKSFELDQNDLLKRIYIYFEGVYRDGEVYINGKSLGMRPEGYISYMYDLTPFIKTGKNIIAVRVDHSKYNDTRWYSGSGIYRDVYLVKANAVHIDQWGVYITTPEVSEKKSVIKATISVVNKSSKDENVIVVNELIDKNNKIINKISSKLCIKANSKSDVTGLLKINNPGLWSVDTPNLYYVRTIIKNKNEVIDQTTTTIGIRSLSFDPDNGFSLNGKNMKVKGVCLHHDAGCLGSAVPKEVWKLRLERLKEIGCNAIRTSHNPQAPVLYELCDELGLLVMNEAFDEWEYPKKKWVEGWNAGTPTFDGHSEFFNEWGETDLKDMILRDRNHPSVFMWSIGNEVDYPNDPYSHPILNKEGIQQQHQAGYQPDKPNAERLGGIAKRLAAVVKKYDPSRPVTAGLAGPIMSNETEYPGALDVAGYNYTESRYEMDHKKYPQRVLYGSENGHGYDAWKYVRDYKYIFGQFLWTGIDYLGESYRWPSRGFGSGLLDIGSLMKPRAFFRMSLWSEKPMIYAGTQIVSRGRGNLSMDAMPLWNYRDGQTVRVLCYTNCKTAKLLINGVQEGDIKKYDDNTGIIYWDVPYKPGKLEVLGFNDDKEVAKFEINTSKKPNAIKAKVINNKIQKDGSVSIIELQIVDENGIHVIMADNMINCLTDGKVKVIGMEGSNMSDMTDYKDNSHRAYQGKLVVYVQSTGITGKSTIRFTSPWLEDTTVEVDVN